MMQTGPVVTLKVAKFGASYHGLGALLSEPTSERTTGEYTITIVVVFLNFLLVMI